MLCNSCFPCFVNYVVLWINVPTYVWHGVAEERRDDGEEEEAMEALLTTAATTDTTTAVVAIAIATDSACRQSRAGAQ